MNRSVQSTNHTNDNRTNVTITETSTKTLFFLIFQSETCCKPTLVTRYYSGKVSRNRIFHRLRTSMLDTLEIALLQPHGILIWIIDLHFMAKWRSPSFKYRRGFDLLANLLKIQQRTTERCSYFQFLSSHLAIFTVSPRKFRRYGDSGFTMGTKCIVWHQIFERQAQRTVLQKLPLWLSCIQFCAWTPSFPTTQGDTI